MSVRSRRCNRKVMLGSQDSGITVNQNQHIWVENTGAACVIFSRGLNTESTHLQSAHSQATSLDAELWMCRMNSTSRVVISLLRV